MTCRISTWQMLHDDELFIFLYLGTIFQTNKILNEIKTIFNELRETLIL